MEETRVLTLDAGEQAVVSRLVSSLPTARMPHPDTALLELTRSCAAELPKRMQATAARLANGLVEGAAIRIRNLPVDEYLPDSPIDGGPSSKKTTTVSEYTLLLSMTMLGEVVGYREEKMGALVHDVCPKPGSEEKQENTGSVYFDLHTENAFHPCCPDYVGLVCLRADHDRIAMTLAASAAQVVHLLEPKELQLLRQPLFQTRMPTSFSTPGGDVLLSEPKPILWGSNRDPRLCVHTLNTVPLNDEASRAKQALLDALRERLTGWVLEPGDIMIVDNRRAVHARSTFRPRYDGSDRWLQRVYAICDDYKVACMRAAGSHVLSSAPTSVADMALVTMRP